MKWLTYRYNRNPYITYACVPFTSLGSVLSFCHLQLLSLPVSPYYICLPNLQRCSDLLWLLLSAAAWAYHSISLLSLMANEALVVNYLIPARSAFFLLWTPCTLSVGAQAHSCLRHTSLPLSFGDTPGPVGTDL